VLNVALVTGPTKAYDDRGVDGRPFHVASFEEQVNAKLADLADQGIDPTAIQLDCKPMQQGWHACYLSWESTRATSYSAQQLSQRTGIPVRTITAMVARGDLPRLNARTRRVFIPAGHPAVAKLLSSQQ
jgi:hypothetical protein